MNFDAFKETLTSFARTADRLRTFGNPAIENQPLPPPLSFPEIKHEDEIPRLDTFAALHALCSQHHRISANQSAWNQQFQQLCLEISERLPLLWDALRVEDGPQKKAKSQLDKMRGKFKEAKKRSRSPQRKTNALLLKGLQYLVRAHRGLGKRRLKTLGIAEDEFRKKADASLRDAERSNSRAGRGLRRLLGSFALDQRSVNHSCFRIVERILQIHSRFHRLQMHRQHNAFQESALSLQHWLLNARPGSSTTVGAAPVVNRQRVAADLLRQMRENSRFIPQPELATEIAATANFYGSAAGPFGKEGFSRTDPVEIVLDNSLKSLWASTNERVVERFWVMNRMPPMARAPKVLDLGCCHSLLALELASNGYDVTAVDGNIYPYQHPNLRALTGDLCALPFPDGHFDTVVLLSTIEHVGLGHYGDEAGETKDLEAMREAARVLKQGGTLLLTTPFGVRAQNKVHRIYDEPALKRLLASFEILESGFAIRKNDHVWERCDDKALAAEMRMVEKDGSPGAVALVAARKN